VTICQKCNFNLKGASAPKFKGTMLMMNQPPLPDMPGASGGASEGVVPPADKAPAAAPAAAAPRVSAPMPPRIKGTMVGMAPPADAFGAFGAPPAPSTSQPAYAATQAFSFEAPPPPAAPPAAPTPGAVNPLGGTLAVDQLNFGAAPPEVPAQAAAGVGSAPAAVGDPFGGSQAGQGGYGGFAPPAASDVAHQGYGQLSASGPGHAAMGHGAPYGQSGGYGPPAGFGGPPGGYGGGGEPVNTQTALILAFASILCGCGIPMAALPIFFAFQAKTAAEQGRNDEARSKVKLVKILVFTGMGLQLVGVIVWFLMFGLAIATSSH
jgi:hypothetical protein